EGRSKKYPSEARTSWFAITISTEPIRNANTKLITTTSRSPRAILCRVRDSAVCAVSAGGGGVSALPSPMPGVRLAATSGVLMRSSPPARTSQFVDTQDCSCDVSFIGELGVGGAGPGGDGLTGGVDAVAGHHQAQHVAVLVPGDDPQDPPAVHHGDAVRELRDLVQLGRDDHDRGALVALVEDAALQELDGSHVHAAGGLGGDQQGELAVQRSRHDDL